VLVPIVFPSSASVAVGDRGLGRIEVVDAARGVDRDATCCVPDDVLVAAEDP
jgi:hypothetical protein